MDKSQFTPEELQFISSMKRPAKLNRRSAKRLIDELDSYIEKMQEEIRSTKSRIRKNQLYARIDGRKAQIKIIELLHL